VRDVGVVIDLAVHDLDVMRFITGKEAIRVYAETERCIHTSQEDMLTALLRFQGGVVGTLMVNWLTPAKVRELQVVGERGMFKVDYLTQDLYFYENAITQGPNWEPLSVMRGVSEGRMIRHAVLKAEPLRTELSQFLSAVMGKPALIVSGEDGIQALRMAHALVQSGAEQQLVHL
jgi:predicted dehydrogenase